MKVLTTTQYFIPLIAAAMLGACQTEKPASNLALEGIELLRGDIALCGNPEFGEVSFTLSCNYDVRETFDLAVSLLHSFEHEEAEKAFVKVVDMDPDCAMAYWGLAMCKIGHPKFGPKQEVFNQGVKILDIAEALPKTPREQEYLLAVGAYYEDDWGMADHYERSKKMELKMGEIYERYQDDKEAAILYSLALFTTAPVEDKTYASRKKAGIILESIFAEQPNHPGIAHYIIHNYDAPTLAQLALPHARRYADIAPASAHAQHMPSHIFTRLGLWDESIESNVMSASSAVCYAEEVEMDGHWGDEIHAMDYLVYAYLQQGDNVNANLQYEYLKTIHKVNSQSGTPYNFGAIPLRIVLENRLWAEASAIEIHESDHEWEKFPWEKSLIHFTRVLGASHIGDIELAEKELRILTTLQQDLEEIEDQYKADQVMVQLVASQAWIEFAKGNNQRALALMRESADLEDITEKHPLTPGELLPAMELLGDMQMAMNLPDEALISYELNLKEHPNRFNGIYGAAIAANDMGDQEQAKMYFEMLLALTESSNSDRPEVAEARQYVISVSSL